MSTEDSKLCGDVYFWSWDAKTDDIPIGGIVETAVKCGIYDLYIFEEDEGGFSDSYLIIAGARSKEEAARIIRDKESYAKEYYKETVEVEGLEYAQEEFLGKISLW